MQCLADQCWKESKLSSSTGPKNQTNIRLRRVILMLIRIEQILNIDLSYKSREAMPTARSSAGLWRSKWSSLMVSNGWQTTKQVRNSVRNAEKGSRTLICARRDDSAVLYCRSSKPLSLTKARIHCGMKWLYFLVLIKSWSLSIHYLMFSVD